MSWTRKLVCFGALAFGCGGSSANQNPQPVVKPASEHSAAEHSAAEHSAAEHSAAEHSAAEHSAAELKATSARGVLWRSVTLSGDGFDDSQLGLLRHLLASLLGADWYAALELDDVDLVRESAGGVRYFERTTASPARLEVTVLGGRRLMRAVSKRTLALELPEPWRDSLSHWIEAERRAHLCGAWQKAFDEACPDALIPRARTPEGESVRSTLTRLVGQVSLRSFYQGGVPTDDEGTPLRPLTVRVDSVEGEGVPGVSLLLAHPGGSNAAAQSTSEPRGRAVTNADGIASWDSEVFPNSVYLDTARMLGPLAKYWPGQELTIVRRPVSLKRWSLLVSEVSKGQPSSIPVVEAELSKQLLRRGASPKRNLPSDLALILDRSLKAPASEGQRAERTLALTGIAEGLYGSVDVVLWLDVDSRYAGPMGPNRVWFEARGRLRAYEVWRGIELADVEQSATVSGIGEERADVGARKALTEALVGDLLRQSVVGL